MFKYQIQVTPSINRQGNIQGYRFVHLPTNTDLKASQVDRNLKLNELFKNSNLNQPKNEIETIFKIDNPGEQQLQDWKIDISILSSLLSSIQVDNSNEDKQRLKLRNKTHKR